MILRLSVVFIVIVILFALPFQWQRLVSLSTSFYTSSPLNQEDDSLETVSVLFGGDMMFDRYIRQVTDVVGGDYVFSCIANTLFNAEYVVANLEGPITTNPSVSVGSVVGAPDNYTFTFPPETAALLKRHNIQLVSLANNHTSNFGHEGIDETQRFLDRAGVSYIGGSRGSDTYTAELNGVSLAFISYNQFSPEGWRAEVEKVEGLIREAKLLHIPIVFAHWGEEYVPATENQKEVAHRFVDAGAEAVIGSHPHVVQEHEIYKKVPIYYSLGNFIFDQYFDDAVKKGMLVRVTFSKNGFVAAEGIPTILTTDGRVCLREA